MKAFDEIWTIAATRMGGVAALEAHLAGYRSKTPAEIAATPDDRILASMARQAFQAALIRDGVLEKPPSGKKDLQKVQAAFNAWSAQSGRDLTALSRVLAMSVGV